MKEYSSELFNKLNKRHEDAMDYIKEIMNETYAQNHFKKVGFKNDEEYLFQSLAKAILLTEYSPYVFLPSGYGCALTTATNIENFLLTLHHAMIDDGDICFIKNNDDIIIEFADFDDAIDIIFKSEFHYVRSISQLKQVTVHDMIDFLLK